MTTTKPRTQLTIDAFVETRGPKPYLVFHPVGDPADWRSLHNKYNRRRRFGHGTTETPHRGPNNIPLAFYVHPDRFIIHSNRERTNQCEHIRFSNAWIGINRPVDDAVMWLPLDDDEITINNHRQTPPDHLETDAYVIRGAVGSSNEDEIMEQVRQETGLPRFLLAYQEKGDGYEVTVHVPRARTIRYDELREQHIAVQD